MDSSLIRQSSKRLQYLSCSMVEKAKSGHPGAPMGQADFLTVLFSQFLKITPQAPDWINRDRFILSCGHASAGLYSLYHSCGFDFSMDDLKQFRQIHAKTAGHPEYELPIEATTGPLGQGLGNAVGQAIARKRLESLLGSKAIDYKVYVCVSDGCLSEGISQEALSLAGHLQLDDLVILYDSNDITIDGSLSQSFSENMRQRIESLGINYQKISGHNVEEIFAALQKTRTDKGPHFIEIKTHIGKNLKDLEGTSKCHGAPIGPERLAELKKDFGIERDWFLPPEHYDLFNLKDKYQQEYENWYKTFGAQAAVLLKHLSFASQHRPDISLNEASRKTMSRQIEYFQQSNSLVIGGSCDLAGSCYTTNKASIAFDKDTAGNNLAFGVREHASAAICNGMAQAGLIPFSATFLVFSDYMLPSIRLSALSGHKVLYIFTHDSIGVGEDGPTHQPIEQLTHLRDIPNLTVFRPHNESECALALEEHVAGSGPTAVVLSRQKYTQHPHLSVDENYKGMFFLKKSVGAQLTILSSGAELSLAMSVAQSLESSKGIKVDVISIPSLENCPVDQVKRYQKGTNTRLCAIEASTALHWAQYMPFDHIYKIQGFGASAPCHDVYEYKGFTKEKIMDFFYQLLTPKPIKVEICS